MEKPQNHTDNLVITTVRQRKKQIWRTNNTRLATQNIRSWNQQDQEIIEMERNKIDICVLEEKKCKCKGTRVYNTYTFIHSEIGKSESAEEKVAQH